MKSSLLPPLSTSILFGLNEENQPRTPEDYDKFICAELPDPIDPDELFKLVTKLMIHVGKTTRRAHAWSMEYAPKAIPSHFRSSQSMVEKAFTLSTEEDIQLMVVSLLKSR